MNTQNTTTKTEDTPIMRYLLVAGLVLLAFFMSYRYAEARSGASRAPATSVFAQPTASGTGTADSPGCCCGGSGTGETIEGAAVVDADGVQRIAIDASAGYNPNVIRLAAGVPVEITFSQGGGCMAQVMSRDLGFFEDLTTGSKTITLPALQPGTYGFSCGMEMVFGSIVVE